MGSRRRSVARYIEEELVALSFQIWFPSKLSAPLVQCSIRYSVQSLNLTMGHDGGFQQLVERVRKNLHKCPLAFSWGALAGP